MNKVKMIVAAGVLLTLGGIYYFRRTIKNGVRNMINGSYFTIEELCRSTTATAQGIDNTPSETAKKNMQRLITTILDPIRERYGGPITVSSGYRSEKLNKAVGGVSNSYHMKGLAADLVGAHRSDEERKAIFRAALAVGGYDQLILEQTKDGKTKWVHVGLREESPRKQLYAIVKGGDKRVITASNWEQYA